MSRTRGRPSDGRGLRSSRGVGQAADPRSAKPSKASLQNSGVVVGRQIDDVNGMQPGWAYRGCDLLGCHSHLGLRPARLTQNKRLLPWPPVPVDYGETAAGFQDRSCGAGEPCLVGHTMEGVGDQHPIDAIGHQFREIIRVAHCEGAVCQAFRGSTVSRKHQHRRIEINRRDVPDHPGKRNCEETVPAAEINHVCLFLET
jgi:hypothetical protein